MDELDRLLIQEYVFMPRKIKRINQHLAHVQDIFYDRTFIGSGMSYLDDGMTPIKTPSVETTVIEFVDEERELLSYIDLCKFKNREFSKYRTSLSLSDWQYLVRVAKRTQQGQKTKLNVKTLNEIRQIEEACGYRFGLLADEAIDQPEDNNDIQSIMAQVMGMKDIGETTQAI